MYVELDFETSRQPETVAGPHLFWWQTSKAFLGFFGFSVFCKNWHKFLAPAGVPMLSDADITSDSMFWNWLVHSFHSKLSSKLQENRNLAGAEKHEYCQCAICTTKRFCFKWIEDMFLHILSPI
jgi:hypothetical protein